MGQQPRSVDDFAEFMNTTYQPLLDAFASADLHAVVTTGMAGNYLTVTNSADAPTPAVEITDGGMPLPDDPADVSMWALSTPNRVVRLHAHGWEPLVRAAGSLLHV